MKKLITLFLSIVMVLGTSVPALATTNVMEDNYEELDISTFVFPEINEQDLTLGKIDTSVFESDIMEITDKVGIDAPSNEFEYFPEAVETPIILPETIAAIDTMVEDSIMSAVNSPVKLIATFGLESSFEYVDYPDHIVLTKYTGLDQFIDIPAVFNGKRVVIGETLRTGSGDDLSQSTFTGPFANCEDLFLVVIEPGVEVENNNADYMFYGCSSLSSAPVLSDDVVSMVATFYGCNTMLDCGVLPTSLVNMSYTFYGCESLEGMPNLPVYAKYFHKSFMGCTSLTTISELPANAEDFNSAFRGCSGITSLPVLGNYVIDVTSAFEDCTSISGDIMMPDSIMHATGVFNGTVAPISVTCNITSGAAGVSYPINVTLTVTDNFDWDFVESGSFYTGIQYTGDATMINVPSEFRGMPFRVNAAAFKANTGIVSVNFSDDALFADTNGSEMFMHCQSLTTVNNIPDNITNMNKAYQGCTSLTTAPVYPSSMKTANYTFYECTNLTDPGVLPATTTNLGFTYAKTGLTTFPIITTSVVSMSGTFQECLVLTGNITIPNNLVDCIELFKNTILPISFTYETSCDAAYNSYVPINVTKIPIGELPWEYTRKTDGVYSLTKYIGTSTIVTLPVTFQGGAASWNITNMFRGNTKVKEVILPTNDLFEHHNGDYMFFGCSSLEKVTGLPTDMSTMKYGFYNCKNLIESPVIPAKLTLASFMYYNCVKITSTPDISNIVDATNMFRGNTSLTTVVGTFNKVSKASNVFNGCVKLTGEVKFGNLVTEFNDSFRNTVLSITVTYPTTNNVIKNAVVPSNVTKITY